MNIMSNSLVSIVVPSYNHGRFISKMIDSVIAQSYSNWEMIIVDNHSNDNTDQIIKKYQDRRIKIIKINNGGIVAVSRNRGIEESKGEWIAFLDSDDVWFQQKLERCMSIADKTDLIYHDMKVYNADENLLLNQGLKSRKLVSPVFKDLLMKGNTLINSSVIVRRSLLEEVNGLNEDKSLVAVEDYHLWLKIAQKTDRFVHIPEQMGYYTIHGFGLSQRDTTFQLEKVVDSFSHLLTRNEQIQIDSFIRYARIRNMLNTKKITSYRNDLLFCLLNGSFDIKLKSIFSFFQLVYYRIYIASAIMFL